MFNQTDFTMSRESSECEYFDINEFSRCLSGLNMNFNVFHINIRSFYKNSSELFIFLTQLPVMPQVLVFTETWFSHENVVDVDGYIGYHTCRSNRRGGGVSVYVRSTLVSRQLSEWSGIVDSCEMSGVEFNFNDKHIKILGVYRPPDCNVISFSDCMENLLSVVKRTEYVFLIGDINMDLLSNDDSCSRFVDVCHSSSFLPLINLPTHVSNNGRDTCIDHIWFNQPNYSLTAVFKIDITDHFPFLSMFSFCGESSNCSNKIFRDHSQVCLLRLRDSLKNYCDNFILNENNDVCTEVENFVSSLYEIYNSCCPIRSKCLSNKNRSKPWISSQLIDCINHKHFLFRQYKSGIVNFDVYNDYKNYVSTIVRNARAGYFHAKFSQCKNDGRTTWNTINNLIGGKGGRSRIGEIECDGVNISDPQIMADSFNAYFCNIAADLENRIPPGVCQPIQYMGQPSVNSMFVSPSTSANVLNVINRLKNKGASLYSVPTYIFKYCSDLLSPIISRLFNFSLDKGTFPACLKGAVVTPVHKAGNKKCIGNYRPISTLPLLSKIFEKVMLQRLNSFIQVNNILCNNQFGFRESSSTSDALLEFFDFANNSLNVKNTLVSVFLDFSKAFDTVNHTILLQKLEHMGVRGIVNNWFESYLSGRSQCVTVGQATSSHRLVDRGVPQGSVLGPTLFLLYINDMSNCCPGLKLVHFADDTTAMKSMCNPELLIREINDGLVMVRDWLCANRLSLNVGKTSYMVISDRSVNDLPVAKIGDHSLNLVDSSKFLGLNVDSRLNFKLHTAELCKKLSQTVGVLNRLAGLVPPRVKLVIYNSLIYSRVSYGITSWGKSNITSIKRVERILSRARKSIEYSVGREGTISGDLFKFNTIYEYFTAIKFYKVVKLGQHSYFSQLFDCLVPSHDHETRFSSGQNYMIPYLSKSKCQKSFYFQSVTVWNRLPDDVKCCDSIVKFKKLLRKWLLERQKCLQSG